MSVTGKSDDAPNTEDAPFIPYANRKIQTNGLMIQRIPWGLERVFDYEAGGHHPVHLNDILHERYKVIHKLGHGGYSIVWLCRDTSVVKPKYVAIKIVIASETAKECQESRIEDLTFSDDEKDIAREFILLPLERFEIKGPNGTHRAFVYPVLGPRVSRLMHVAMMDDPGPTLRKLCFEATQGLALLHAHSICHGGMYSTLIHSTPTIAPWEYSQNVGLELS